MRSGAGPMATVRAPDPRLTAAEPGDDRVDTTRARQPDRTGFVATDGVRVHVEVYGEGEPTIVFAPTWSIVTSRVWKSQIPYFARRHRVVTFDPRGNGRSDRPSQAAAYAEPAFAEDLLAVMDATGVERAVVVSLSLGAQRSLIAAAEHPDRIAGLVLIGPAVPMGQRPPDRVVDFEIADAPDEGWARYNRHSWRRDYRGFLEFFFGRGFTEPHSTKQIEDAVGWGMETDAETLILTEDAPGLDAPATEALCRRVRCPTLVIQGREDAVTGPTRGSSLAEAIVGARLVSIAGGGHFNNARDPVLVNRAIRDFVHGLEPSS
jgi:pimeloyl-ACP methyl ester carboxylesterase